jgi:hypothetical protein
MSEHPKVKMGANMAAKQARKLEREEMVTAVKEEIPVVVEEETAPAEMPEAEPEEVSEG